MLVVKIELWPGGFEDHPRKAEIGRMYIANDGEGTVERGNYTAAVCRRGSTTVPQPLSEVGPRATRVGLVKDYPRLAYNVWRLIARALRSAFPEEK